MADLYVIATIVSKADEADALRATLLTATGKFRQEDGCLAYTLLEDKKRPGRFMTYERWRDTDALEAHMAFATMDEMKPLLPDLLGEEMTQDFLEAHLIL